MSKLDTQQIQLLSRIGLLHLKEAVIEVLCDAKRKGEKPLGFAEVSGRADIFRGKQGKFNDGIAAGILYLLEKEGRAHHTPKVGWVITDEEFDRRDAG